MRIQEEKIGRYWIKEYKEIREMSTVHRHRLKLILGVKWSKILLLLAAVLAIVGMAVYFGQLEKNRILDILIVPVLIVIITEIIIRAVWEK